MQRRFIIATLSSVVVMLLGLGIVSHISVDAEIEHSLQQNLELASTAASYADYLIQTNLARLFDISLSGAVDFSDGDWRPEQEALQTAFQYSIFSDGVFIMDHRGEVRATYPPRQISATEPRGLVAVRQALGGDRPIVTDVETLPVSGRRAIFALAPVRDRKGEKVGLVGGEIAPTHHFLSNIVRAVPVESHIVIELVDQNGTVIASTQPTRVFSCADRDRILAQLIADRDRKVLECHRCHGEPARPAQDPSSDMLAFAALTEAPWGVAVREPAEEVFAASNRLRRYFVVLGVVIVISATILAVGVSRSIVNPIKTLTAASRSIASGQLSEPVQTAAYDEVGELAHGFEVMRKQLAVSLANLKQANLKLEDRVLERTKELERSRRTLSRLLGKVLNAQEEERRRIARELHDETLQAVSALGLSIQVCSVELEKQGLLSAGLAKISEQTDQLTDGINAIIRDLRPPRLDDLGLKAAVQWLLETHLEDKQISCRLDFSEPCRRAVEAAGRDPKKKELPLALFRIVQEGIINIAKHAEATVAAIRFRCENNRLRLTIEDDGRGFDVSPTLEGKRTRKGYGLLGLRERVWLLGGDVAIESEPGQGTRLKFDFPLVVSGLGGKDERTDANHDRG